MPIGRFGAENHAGKNANDIAWSLLLSSAREAFDGKLVEWMEKVTDQEYLTGPATE